MRYQALATDYDGTLAQGGVVDPPVIDALTRVKASGRKLILVTGRILPELLEIFPQIALFDRVIAENGALLYRPDTQEEKQLANPPPETFYAALQQTGMQPLIRGRVIIATCHPEEHRVLDIIRKLGLELTVVFNKGAVMILPSGITKETGLRAALKELQISPENVVGAGDGENDHIFLQACGCAVAVANALPMLKELADVTMKLPAGSGMLELIEELVRYDLMNYHPRKRLVPPA